MKIKSQMVGWHKVRIKGKHKLPVIEITEVKSQKSYLPTDWRNRLLT